jgi:hypothetical protein
LHGVHPTRVKGMRVRPVGVYSNLNITVTKCVCGVCVSYLRF